MLESAPLMLSVSGMRGIVGQSLTPARICQYVAAFGSRLREQVGPDRPARVVLGRDSRPSGDMYEMAAASALVGVGCQVIRLGIVSTPGVAVMSKALQADGGLVITASHNPVIWNGLKPLRSDGTSFPADEVEKIIAAYHAGQASHAPVEDLQPVADDTRTADLHTEAVLQFVDADLIRQAQLTVAVDSVHGAGGPEAMHLLRALGVKLHHFHREPTGRFPHPPEPTREHLQGFCENVRQYGVAVGFAQDPDADRLALIDEAGHYIGEEYTLALAALHLMGKGDVAVANLSTSRMIDDIARNVGGQVVRTAVGEANVAQGMRDHQARVGGEGNGGIIDPRVSYVRDSIVGMAHILELLAKRQQPLSAIVSEIPRYEIVKTKAPAEPDLVAQLGPKLRDAFSKQKIDTQDGVRIDWDDRWLHVRPSNTEPIVRLIAEARDGAAAQQLIAEAQQVLGLAM